MRKAAIVALAHFLVFLLPSAGAAAERWSASAAFGGAEITGITSDRYEQAWAVSSDPAGGIYYFDGSGWSLQTLTGTPLQAVDSYAPYRVFAVGNLAGSGRIFIDDGSGWRLQTTIAGAYLYDVFATPWNYNWAVGNNGIIYRNYGSDQWIIHTDTGTDDWHAIDGIDQENFWVVGKSCGGLNKVMNWYGPPANAWTMMTHINLGGTNRLLDMAVVSPPDLWFGGDDGIIVHFDDGDWSIFTDLGTETVRSMAAYPEGEEGVLAGTGGGKIFLFNGSGWVLQTDLGGGAVGALDRPGEYTAWAGKGGIIYQSRPVRRTFDYDGDGHSEIAVFRESSGLWAIRGLTRLYFGTAGDEPVPGDYDGNGTTDIGLFRPSSGLWAVRNVTRSYFGASSDRPLARDYDGDGRADPGVFRPGSGLWAVKGITRFYFGGSGDTPLPEDYGAGDASGDGTADIMIFRGATGLWALRGVSRAYFGRSGDIPACGYYHDPRGCSVAVFRPSSGLWSVMMETRWYFGSGSDTPVPANFKVANYLDQIGVFRESSGLWAWYAEGGRAYFGGPGDIPVAK